MAATAPALGGGDAVSLSEALFGEARNDSLVHEVVKAELASKRQGTHATRSRGMVSGGRSKPWRQKGTGRARAGTTRAAQWTGGGVVFGPQPRGYAVKVNRKARAKALRIALSAHADAGTLAVLDADALGDPRTSRAAELVGGWRAERPLVVVVGEGEEAVDRAFRNLARTHVVPTSALDVADVLWARSLVVTRAALTRLGGGEGS